MKHTKHTPGPWTTDRVAPESALIYVLGGPNDTHIVCELRTVCERASAEDAANARLIAAAPDLLEALEEFILCGPNAGHNQDLLRQVKKALVKARGKK